MTEIFRAGIQAIGIGQHEAAQALGMSRIADFAPHRFAPGLSCRHPAHRQRIHRDDEGLVPGVSDVGMGIDLSGKQDSAASISVAWKRSSSPPRFIGF